MGFEAYQIAELERADRSLHRLNEIWLSRFMTDHEKKAKNVLNEMFVKCLGPKSSMVFLLRLILILAVVMGLILTVMAWILIFKGGN